MRHILIVTQRYSTAKLWLINKKQKLIYTNAGGRIICCDPETEKVMLYQWVYNEYMIDLMQQSYDDAIDMGDLPKVAAYAKGAIHYKLKD